ncbi:MULTISPECIES: NAD-dependent epimerase/dehydratase family protein [Sphingobacterium]|uniref:NAD-dependent epimerase/dehydratase family protein n=1 Tax=Sphingobacterium TaxID=28453 RepID=UPI00257A8852|nr:MULTISPECIES: NAD-dependent epimerase/dehydratase family protein [Sphingobacterium]
MQINKILKNILITGGAGFIGSNLALKLIEKGYNVTVLDNLSPQIHGDNPKENSSLYLSIKDKVKFIFGSVTSEIDWKAALVGQDAIVHYAAETGTGQSMYEVKKYVDVNIGGTSILLDLLVNTEHTIKKVVVASSRSIYGEGKYISEELGAVYPTQRTASYMDMGDFDVKYDGASKLRLVGTDEESKIHPSSVYGITKQNQEQMIMTVCPTVGIAAVAFRYQNVYGPGQSLKNPYTGILSIFSTQIKNGNGINIFEDGNESRDFVFIDDVVDATILGLEKDEANNNVFNVGTGVATDVLTVANQLIKNYGIEVPVTISGNYRLGDIRHNYADLCKINRLLNFKPKVSFEIGLQKFTEWVNTQSIQEDQYQKSIEEMKAKGLYK